jgi:hypothetical protein
MTIAMRTSQESGLGAKRFTPVACNTKLKPARSIATANTALLVVTDHYAPSRASSWRSISSRFQFHFGYCRRPRNYRTGELAVPCHGDGFFVKGLCAGGFAAERFGVASVKMMTSDRLQ